MQYPPVAVLLSYPTPNYVDPEQHGPALIITLSILFPFALLVVGLRTYTRVIIAKSFGWDDGVILVAFIPATAFMIVGVLCTELYGSNLHLWDVRPEILTFATKLLIVTQCLFASSAALTKISMNLLVCRIVSKGTSRIRIAAKIASWLIGLNALVFCLVIIFQCNPVSLYWTWSFEKQNCINQTLHVLIAGCINTFFDCVTVLLPIPLVWKLNLPLRQRVVVFALFFAGVVVCIAGCVRTVYTYRLSISYDQTWACYSVWLSSTVELYVGIIGASIPPLKPFFSHLAPKFLSRISGSNYIISHLSFFNNPIKSPQVSGADSVATTQNTHYPYSPRSTYDKTQFASFREENYEDTRENPREGCIEVTREFRMGSEKGSREGRVVSIQACGPTTPMSAEFIYVGPKEKRGDGVITTIESLSGRGSVVGNEEVGFCRVLGEEFDSESLHRMRNRGDDDENEERCSVEIDDDAESKEMGFYGRREKEYDENV